MRDQTRTKTFVGGASGSRQNRPVAPRITPKRERFFVAFRKHAGSARIEVAIDDAIRARAIERAHEIVRPIAGLTYEGTD